MLDIGPGGAVACSAMPQTEILIQVVLDGTHQLDAQGQSDLQAAVLHDTSKALGGGVLISRTSIEVRPVPEGTPDAAPETAEAAAPTADAAAPAEPAKPGHAAPSQAHRPSA